jgi:histidine triad (HIT) family protein
MKECVFCRIIAGETPAEILFENQLVVSILDTNPIHFGHALVMPRRHFRDFLDLEQDCYSSLLEATQIITRALVKSLNLEGYNLFSNNGVIAGQSVFHFHLHVTPRYQNDDIRFVLKLKKYENGEMQYYANLIKQNIESN